MPRKQALPTIDKTRVKNRFRRRQMVVAGYGGASATPVLVFQNTSNRQRLMRAGGAAPVYGWRWPAGVVSTSYFNPSNIATDANGLPADLA
jgi:hypothetical protein